MKTRPKNKPYKLIKGLVHQKLGEKIAIFDGEESLLYAFNSTASFIFDLIKRGASQNKIIEEIFKTYSVDKRKAKDDVEEFVQDLIEKKIIEKS